MSSRGQIRIRRSNEGYLEFSSIEGDFQCWPNWALENFVTCTDQHLQTQGLEGNIDKYTAIW